MKKLAILLFIIALPVFAGEDKPIAEIETEYHTVREEWRALPWSHKRKLASGLSLLSGFGLTLVSAAEGFSTAFSGETNLLVIESIVLGLGLTGTGCYLAFSYGSKTTGETVKRFTETIRRFPH